MPDEIDAVIHLAARAGVRPSIEDPGAYDVVNFGGARTIALRAMIDEVASALGVRPNIRRLDDQPGDVRRTFADVSEAERMFGYRPQVPFDEGIRRFADWLEQERSSEPVGVAV